MYHGFADPLIAPQTAIDYYMDVVRHEGRRLGRTQRYFRLFMVPGMNHCYGGPGPHVFGNQFSGNIAIHEPPEHDANHHALLALIRWVERGRAPDKIIATKYVGDQPGNGVAMQRPICPYPQMPRYRGGDVTKAGSYVCSR
jgi:feruloyl esterase